MTTATATASEALPAAFAYNLTDLQRVAREKYGLTPRTTRETAQRLYERGLISYPMTDSRELPVHLFDEMAKLVRDYKLVSGDRAHDPARRARGWVQDLSSAHHGIALTTLAAAALFGGIEWTEQETQVYGLVRARILDLFRRAGAGA
jgi:DNA topoisomerase-3